MGKKIASTRLVSEKPASKANKLFDLFRETINSK